YWTLQLKGHNLLTRPGLAISASGIDSGCLMSVSSTRGVVTPWPRGLIDDGQSDEKTESGSETNRNPAHRRRISDHDQTQDDKCTNDQTAHDTARQNSI